MLIESIPLWTVNLAATNHIARNWVAYVEFRWISFDIRWIYVGNNSKVEVKGTGTCKLELHREHTLLTWCSLCFGYSMKFGLCVSPSWFRFQFEFLWLGNGVVFGNNILWFWICSEWFYGSWYWLILMIVIIRWWLLLEIHVIMWSYDMLDLGIWTRKNE